MSARRTIQRRFTSLHCTLYRATGGAVGSHLRGAQILLLRTTGRRTGLQRETPLLYLCDGDCYVLVASNGGATVNPCWFLNLERTPEVEVQVGESTRAMRARKAVPAERDELWRAVTSHYPGYLQYQERTSRTIPIVVLEPVGA